MSNFADTAKEITEQSTKGEYNLCAVLEKNTKGAWETRVIGVDEKGRMEMTVDTPLSGKELLGVAKPVLDETAKRYFRELDNPTGRPMVACIPAPPSLGR